MTPASSTSRKRVQHVFNDGGDHVELLEPAPHGADDMITRIDRIDSEKIYSMKSRCPCLWPVEIASGCSKVRKSEPASEHYKNIAQNTPYSIDADPFQNTLNRFWSGIT